MFKRRSKKIKVGEGWAVGLRLFGLLAAAGQEQEIETNTRNISAQGGDFGEMWLGNTCFVLSLPCHAYTICLNRKKPSYGVLLLGIHASAV